MKKQTQNIFNDIISSLCSLLRIRNVSTRLKIGFVLITVLPVLAVGYFLICREQCNI